MINKICEYCTQAYEVYKYKEFTSKYCSRKCQVLASAKARRRPLLERFNEKMGPIDINGCINWKGTRNGKGNGIFFVTKLKGTGFKQFESAHRMAYRLFKGEIIKGYEVCHTCDNGYCVNIDHLWLGTHKENMHDMIKKKRNRPGGKDQK